MWTVQMMFAITCVSLFFAPGLNDSSLTIVSMPQYHFDCLRQFPETEVTKP
jgi:hypothetical protein